MTVGSAPAFLAWPPDYVAELIARQHRLRRLKTDAGLRAGLAERYREDPAGWIAHWAVTYDPRKAASDAPTVMPFVPFPRQIEMIAFLHASTRRCNQKSTIATCEMDRGRSTKYGMRVAMIRSSMGWAPSR